MSSNKLLVTVLLVSVCAMASACTSVLVPRVEHPPAPEPGQAAEPEAQLTIGRVALATGGEPAIVLEEDGRIVHATCEGRLDEDGKVRDRSGAVTLQLTPSGAIEDRDGRTAFTLEGSTLRRASGSTAQLADGHVTFEGSPELTLDVERAEGADDRAVLLLVAALSICEP